ncbi:MAG: phosphotransferase, partial [Synechococcaceae cyanobacterium]|nr:phosphotransferase [Synechococcaceae cyanobacterium]
MCASPSADAAACAVARAVAERFRIAGPVTSVAPLGNGNVNATFLVRVEAPGEPGYVLQRLNTRVFRQPRWVMGNLQTLLGHVAERLAREAGPGSHGRPEAGHWRLPQVVPARDGEEAWVEDGASFWRMLTYVEGSRTVEVPEDAEQARAVGQALGTFHALIHDLPVDTLADTLEGFHVTPLYLAQYRRALAEHRGPVGEELAWAQAFVAEREELAGVLERARERGELRARPIHGDPKVNNVLLDAASGAAIGLVDLDTVKPGLVQWDIGDCLRSACNPLGEETEDWRAVRFEPALAEALLAGYLGAARGFLEEADYAYLVPAIRLIAFE